MSKPKVFLRSQFNYDADEVSNETGLLCEDVSLTQQHQRDDADINVIVKRFGLTGQLPINVRPPQYGDFTGVTDYQSALNAVMAAERSFMAMPADIRARFENDPEKFVAFCSDEKNLDEMVKMGLAIKKQDPAPKEPPAPAKGEPKKPPEGGA